MDQGISRITFSSGKNVYIWRVKKKTQPISSAIAYQNPNDSKDGSEPAMYGIKCF